MDEEVGDTDKPAVQPRPKSVQARVGLEFAPCSLVHFGWLNALVEVDVGAEQGFPSVSVRRSEFFNADHNDTLHARYSTIDIAQAFYSIRAQIGVSSH
jgi:hypothetical protein